MRAHWAPSLPWWALAGNPPLFTTRFPGASPSDLHLLTGDYATATTTDYVADATLAWTPGARDTVSLDLGRAALTHGATPLERARRRDS